MSQDNGYDTSYFVPTDDAGTPTEPGRWLSWADAKEFSPVIGAVMRPILGKNLLVNYITVEPNSPSPPHAHEEEQITIVLEGEMIFTLGEETRVIKAGEVVYIPSWVNHGGGTGPDSGAVCIDVFNPPREQLRALIEEG
ncbi:MAG: cupin domain-containing protein [Propionibacteriaceae bacterium]|jgi:quercetin dioxygenase-like cupin family protein|nr:cupin domain-containing protein [Propionibacteriaceae bacterium]